MIRPEQAPEPHPLAKISLISKGTRGPRIRYEADKNRYYTLILAKRPRSDAEPRTFGVSDETKIT